MARILVISDAEWEKVLKYAQDGYGSGGWQGLLRRLKAADTEPEDVAAKAKEIGILDARKQGGLFGGS
tara:strand:+ start:4068 stop:4271 length:204 start_codon:yes stop_codon:yes gene_type:complete